MRRPRVTVIGAGNLGTSLAISLHRTGYAIDAVIAGLRSASRRRARDLAKEVGTRIVANLQPDTRSDVVWVCVPDAEIRKAAEVLAEQINWKGRVALHSSGALTSDELDVLRHRGAAVASSHPMMTFVRRSQPSFTAIPFAVEGDSFAVRIAKQLVKDLGGRAYRIRKEDKAAYHAWATFVSPLFTALMATAEQVAETAGIPGKQSRERVIPILRQTLENYAAFGAAGGFSGPIIRGDVDTVKRHLRVLRRMPQAREVYRALALAAVDLLPGKKKAMLRTVLKS